jgi:hypothetical protein
MMQQLGSIEIISGDGQVVGISDGWARFAPLVVLYRNSTGDPTSGHDVQFACWNSPCQFEGFGGTSGLIRIKTDAEGKASAIAKTQIAGPVEIQVAAADVPPQAFHLTAG